MPHYKEQLHQLRDNPEIRRWLKSPDKIHDKIKRQHIRWLGHVKRMTLTVSRDISPKLMGSNRKEAVD